MAGRYVEFIKGEKRPAKDPEYADTPDVFDSCGYEIGGDEVMIDIDGLGKEGIKELIKRFNINTQTVWTQRGVHLYFIKPMEFTKVIQGISPLGFKYEMKTSKNQKAITVKLNGKLRDVENVGVREELPWFFYDRHKYPMDLTGLSEGDGRNNAVFAHRMKLGNRSDIRKILLFINECVLSEPLDDKELDAIASRDASNVQKAITRDATELIMKQYKTVTWQGNICWFDGHKYTSDPDDFRLKQMIMIKYPEQETRFVEEVIKQIKILSDRKDDEIFAIKFNNGFLLDGEFFYSSQYTDFTPYYIDIEYNEDAEPVPLVDEYINQVSDNDPDYRKVVIEAMAYPMILDPEVIRSIGKFFFFRGDGANGKGTMLQIMKKVYGSKNCTSCSPKELADERYLCTLIGKLANLGDDIEPDAINNKTMRVLKNIATADTISMRELFKQAFSGTLTTKLYFTTNTEIKTFEKNYAYKRRVMWLPMFNKVEKPDPKFISKITSKEALQYWMKLFMEGYKRLKENGSFTKSEKIAKFNEEYHKNNNYMNEFIESLDIETDVLGHTGTEVKQYWKDYNDDDSRQYNRKLLYDALEEMGIIIAVVKDPGNKKSRRIFVRAEDTNQVRNKKY